MANGNKLAFIAFDIGGVLATIDKPWFNQHLSRHGIKESQFFGEAFHHLQKGLIKPKEFIKHQCEKTTFPVDDALSAFEKMFKPLMVKEMLDELSIPYFFMSNINCLHFDVMRQHAKITKFAEIWSMLSFRLGHLKPDREFFEQLPLSLKDIATRTLYVDDQPANLHMARRFGFNIALCKRPQNLSALLKQYSLI